MPLISLASALSSVLNRPQLWTPFSENQEEVPKEEIS